MLRGGISTQRYARLIRFSQQGFSLQYFRLGTSRTAVGAGLLYTAA